MQNMQKHHDNGGDVWLECIWKVTLLYPPKEIPLDNTVSHHFSDDPQYAWPPPFLPLTPSPSSSNPWHPRSQTPIFCTIDPDTREWRLFFRTAACVISPLVSKTRSFWASEQHVWVLLDVHVCQTTREIRHPHHHPGAIGLKEKKRWKKMKEKID